MRNLTQRQSDYLAYILEYIRVNHNFPTTVQLADHFKCVQHAAFGHVLALRKKGVIEKVPNTIRYRVVGLTVIIDINSRGNKSD